MDEEEIRDILQTLTELPSEQDLTVLAELLENEFSGVPVLHKVIADSALSKDDKHRIVRYLIEAGADCDQRDKESELTPCQFALERLSDRELASELIRAEVKHIPDLRAFYVIIRRGSLEVFKLFLEMKQFSGEAMFQYVTNAMIELNVKRVTIVEKLEIFLQFLLSSYAHRNLCADLKTYKDVNEWLLHLEVIEDNWKALKQDFSDQSFTNIDNVFLYRIHTIHDHLYFIKDKQFIKQHLPMIEITFCLAIFVAIFKWNSEYEIYKLLINKINIMQFLDVICRQLVHIRTKVDRFTQQMKKLLDNVAGRSTASKEGLLKQWEELAPGQKLGENLINKIISGFRKQSDPQAIVDEIISTESLGLSVEFNWRDRSTLRKLKRCYFRTRHLYSIKKCIRHIKAVSSHTSLRVTDPVTIPAVKRLIQVIGEAIKSTKNSPNMPKKADFVLELTLTPLFSELNKHFREFFSHNYSLAKRLLSGTEEIIYFNAIAGSIDYVEMIFSIALCLCISESSRALLGFMRRCRGLDELATLLQYVPDLQNAELEQRERFGKVEKLLRKANESFSNAGALTEIERSNLSYLKKMSQDQKQVINRLQRCLIGAWKYDFDTLKSACHGRSPIETIHRMIECNLRNMTHMVVFEGVKHRGKQIKAIKLLQTPGEDLQTFNSSIMSAQLNILERMLTVIESEQYMENTKSILKEFGMLNLSQDLIELLHKQLLKYYENLFFLDNKYKAVKQFFKHLSLKVDENLFKLMRKHDEKELQQIFNSQVENMQRILQTYQIATVDELIANIHQIPACAVMALEHYQLELCEILITVGHYGDNFHLMKNRIPLIHGRNYRNYLAHDQLSYNVLTDSSRMKIVINAIAMANCPVDLFGKKPVASTIKLNFPPLEKTLEWTTRQQLLLKSIQEMNYVDIRKNTENGADLHGRFCQIMKAAMIGTSASLSFVDPSSSKDTLRHVLNYFHAKFPRECFKILCPLYRSWYAVQKGNFEKSFEIFAAHQPVSISTLPKHFFHWKQLIPHLRAHSVDFDAADSQGRSILHRLVQAGNYYGVVELLTLKPDVKVVVADATGRTPLDYAIKHGHLDLAKLLLLKTPKLSVSNQLYAVMNHLNDLVPDLFMEVDKDVLACNGYILTAVASKNLFALKYIINHLYNRQYSNLKEKHLSAGLAMAAYCKFWHIVEYLLRLPNVNLFSDEHLENGNVAIKFAIERNWSIVKLLLRSGASPHWIHPARQSSSPFQLCVAADNVQVVRLMGSVDRKLYQGRHHPLAVAIENDSSRMVEYLEEIGFSVLDSNWVLRSAIKYQRVKCVEKILQALDHSVEEWQSEERSIVFIVGNLLSRWKVIAYLEYLELVAPGELEVDSTTVLMEAIYAHNWNLVEVLIEKCKKLREFDGVYLSGIQVYCNQKLIYSNDENFYSQCMELVKDLLNHLKLLQRSASQLTTQFAMFFKSENLTIDAVLFNASPSIKESISNIIHNENLHQYTAALQDLLQGSNGLICGTVRVNSTIYDYFMVCSKAVCLFTISHTKPKYPLKKLVNTGNNDGESPLHVLVAGSCPLTLLELLLANGANPLAMNSEGETPLHSALYSRDCSKAMLLLKTLDAVSALEIPNGQGSRPIHIASMTGKLQAVQFLIDQRVDLRARDNVGHSATKKTVLYSHRSILKLLLDSDPQLVNIEDGNGETVLHYAAMCSDAEMIKLILQYHPDLSKEDRKRCSAIEAAFGFGNVTWLKTVLDYARANQITKLTGDGFSQLCGGGLSLFHFSVFFNQRKLIQIILEYEIETELTSHLPYDSMLKLREQLLSARSIDGFTALHIAVQLNHEESIAFLLHCQCLHNQQSDQKLNLARQTFDLQGKTSLRLAQTIGNQRIIDLLINSQ